MPRREDDFDSRRDDDQDSYPEQERRREPPPQKSSSAMTWILVIGGVGALVLCLACGGVGAFFFMKAKEADRQARSVNNLRQITLAAHNCNDAFGEMPLVSGQWRGIPMSNTTQRSLFFCLLPYLEQENLYKNLLNSGPNAPTNYVIPVYISPDDKSGEGFQGECSYAANWQVFQVWTGSRVTFERGESPQYASIPRSFPDGQTNTVMFAEIYQNCGGNIRKWAQTGASTDHRVPAYNREANNPTMLNGLLALPQFAPSQGNCSPALAQTPYSSGIYVGLADGTARKLSSTISLTTWRRVCCPADGNIPGMNPNTNDW